MPSEELLENVWMAPAVERICNEHVTTFAFNGLWRALYDFGCGAFESDEYDDNEMLCRLACDILRTEGYRAVPASNAAEALLALEEQEFDLLVTAFQMPGMSGLELARTVRDRSPHFPVIVMTAFEPVESEHVTLWLPKQYLFPNLLEKIRYCLTGAKPETEKTGG